MQILSNSMKTPSSLKKKMVPPLLSSPLKHSTPKSRRCGRLFFWSRVRGFQKKKLRPQFSSLRPHQDQGLVPQSPGATGQLDVDGKMRLELLSAKKKKCIFIKMKDLTTWKCDAFLSAKKQMVLLSWSSGLLHICSHHWSNCIIWILAFVSRLPKGKAIGVHVGEVHSVKLHLEISKGEPNQTKKPPAHNSNHTRHFPDLSSRKKNFWVQWVR